MTEKYPMPIECPMTIEYPMTNDQYPTAKPNPNSEIENPKSNRRVAWLHRGCLRGSHGVFYPAIPGLFFKSSI